MTLLELADRIEQAEPSEQRELLLQAGAAIFGPTGMQWPGATYFNFKALLDIGTDEAFTAASMMLIPPGSELVTLVLINRDGYTPSAGIDGGRHIGHAATPALALAAASLKAHAIKETSHA
jgi:hypothetical protein